MSKSVTKNIWVDPDDAPEVTDAMLDRAVMKVAGKPVNRGGRPPGSDKEQVTLRLDRATLERFRAGGSGWQTRINEALRKAAGL